MKYAIRFLTVLVIVSAVFAMMGCNGGIAIGEGAYIRTDRTNCDNNMDISGTNSGSSAMNF